MKKMVIFVVESLLILGLFFPTSTTQATTGITIYVDNMRACDDYGPGTMDHPLCTIYAGANIAVAGSTVRVLAGTYAEKVKPAFSGTAGYPITFSAAPGVTVTGDGTTSGSAFRLTGWSYITVEGFNVTGTSEEGIYLSGSDHITIRNNHVSYAGSPSSGSTRCGIYLSGTTDSMVTGNITDHNSLDGIRLVNGSSNNTVSNNVSFANASEIVRTAEGINVYNNSTSNTIIHNIVYANEDSGLNFYLGSSSNMVIGNVSYGNGDHGIDINGSPNNAIIGNTVQGNVTSGINLEGDAISNSSGATVVNNIMVDNGYLRLVGGGGIIGGKTGNISVDVPSTSGTTLDYNLYYLYSPGSGTEIVWNGTNYVTLYAFILAGTGQEAHGLQANPLFAAPALIAQRPTSAPFNMAVNVGDYHINSGSPAIDSANSDAPGEPIRDIVDHGRVDDLSVVNSGAGVRNFDDRGAYEFWTGYTIMLPLIMR